MKIKQSILTILGSGTSTGIPMIACDCSVCTSTNPFDKRLRSSFHISTKKGKSILIDTSPDLRTQVLANNISNIDFCIITHDHADHLHGIDDLRPFTFKNNSGTIPIYTYDECELSMHKRFEYIFNTSYFSKNRPVIGGAIPKLKTFVINEFFKKVTIEDEEFTFFLLPHGYTKTLGILFESIAIIIDCHIIPAEVVTYLKNQNLEYLIIDCVKEGTHQTHLTLDKSLDYIDQIAAKQSLLTHIGHQLSHEQLYKLCSTKKGPSTAPAHDSMQITF